MFKQPLKLITPSSLNSFNVFLRQEAYCSSLTEPAKKWKWDIISSVCLERHPVITKPMTDLESKMQETLNQIEFEKSHKSNYEIKIEMAGRKKKEDEETENLNKNPSIQELEDTWLKEFEEFSFAPRVTEADEKNITSSLKRKLDKTLLLLTEQKKGNIHFWLPPQTIRNDGETMRQTAERALFDTCGSDLKVKFYGNAPIGYYKYLYPEKVRKEYDSDGAKVFFFLAKYIKGNVPEELKHQWLDRAELSTILNKKVRKSLFQFLIPE